MNFDETNGYAGSVMRLCPVFCWKWCCLCLMYLILTAWRKCSSWSRGRYSCELGWGYLFGCACVFAMSDFSSSRTERKRPASVRLYEEQDWRTWVEIANSKHRTWASKIALEWGVQSTRAIHPWTDWSHLSSVGRLDSAHLLLYIYACAMLNFLVDAVVNFDWQAEDARVNERVEREATGTSIEAQFLWKCYREVDILWGIYCFSCYWRTA